MNTRVLMILNNHYTHDPRVTTEVESLVKHSYEVKVIAWDRKRKYPTHETANNVEVIRIRIPQIIDKLIPFEILKVPIWQVLAYRRALQLYKTWKFGIVHVHDWPDLPVGVWLKRKLKIKLVYDSHEVWNYMVFTNKLPEWLWEAIWRERKLLQAVDAFITVGRGYKRYFIRYVKSVKLVMNAKLPLTQWKKPKTNPLVVVYIGGFHRARCIEELVSATCEVKRVFTVIAGPEIPEYKKLFENSRSCGLKYLGFIPKSRVIPLTREASVVYYVFDPSHPLYKIGMPNKLFEAIATGRASLACKGTASGKFVEEYKIGLVVNCNVEEIKKALITFIENPKLIIKFGRRAYSIGSKYNLERESKKLLEIYKRLLGGTPHDDAG